MRNKKDKRILVIIRNSGESTFSTCKKLVKKQLNKLVNVIKIVELDPEMTIETEVLLLKVSINKDSQTSVIEKANLSGANSVDVGQNYAVFELTGSSKEINKFENLMKPFGIIEMVRGGSIAIQTNL